jgi:hypothetical protein
LVSTYKKFSSTASVRNAVTDSSVVEILNELKRMRTDLVSADDLKNAKAKYIGNFVMQVQKTNYNCSLCFKHANTRFTS